MSSFEFQRIIRAPVERVFALLSDFEHAHENVPSILKIEILTPGVSGKSLRFRETRKMFGKEATEELEVIAFDPGRSYTIGCTSGGMRYETRFDVAPIPEGTRVSLHFSAQALTLAAKLMSPLAKMMSGTVKKCIEDDLDAIAKKAEAK